MLINSETELENLISTARINPFSEVIKPSPIIKIGEEIIATRGNFSCIIGKPKSRKTFLIAALAATVLSNKKEFDLFSSNNKNSTVLHFDTEQSRSDVQATCLRVYGVLKIDEALNNYQPFSLRPFDPRMRLQMIEDIIKNTSNVSLVIIDGIADLVTSYNDEAQASMISNKLLKWTADYNIHVLTVIHENKDNRHAKGHLGSFILQKAETTLNVSKSGTISKVFCQGSRGKQFEPFMFSIDKLGLPFILEGKPDILSRNNKVKPVKEYDPLFLKGIVKRIFEGQNEIFSSELIIRIQKELQKENIEIGQNKCREWLSHFKELKYIYQDKPKGPYKTII